MSKLTYPNANEMEYYRFLQDFVKRLHSSLMSGPVLHKTKKLARDVLEMINDFSHFSFFYEKYREELEEVFGNTISNTQFFAATIGTHLNYGTPTEIFRKCFHSFEEEIERVRGFNLEFKWESPEDIHGSMLLGSQYLIASEIIQLGKQVTQIPGLLAMNKRYLLRFFNDFMDGDRRIEFLLTAKGLINRWFYIQTHPLRNLPPFDVLLPKFKNIGPYDLKVLFAVRISQLFAISFGEPFSFAEILEKWIDVVRKDYTKFETLKEELSREIVDILKKKILSDALYTAVLQSVLEYNKQPNLEKIGSLLVEILSIEDVSNSFVRSLWRRATDKGIVMNSSELLTSIHNNQEYHKLEINFSIFDRSARIPFKSTLEEISAFFTNLKEINDKIRLKHISSIKEKKEKEPSIGEMMQKEFQDLEKRIQVFSKPFSSIISSYQSSMDLPFDISDIIAKSTIYLTYDTLANSEDVQKKSIIAPVLSEYLSCQIKKIIEFDNNFDFKPYILEEIRTLIEILSVPEVCTGDYQIQWERRNPTIDSTGQIIQRVAEIALNWLRLPKNLLYIHPSFHRKELIYSTWRSDIRIFYMLAALRYLKESSIARMQSEIATFFPRRIVPNLNALFIDSSRLVHFLKEYKSNIAR